MKKTLLLTTLISMSVFYFIQVSTSNNSLPTGKQKTVNKTQHENNDSITFKTFNADSGWGYDIFINGKLYIHQPNIPAIFSNKGFTEEKYAEETAKMVILKIKKQILPPSVTFIELDSMKVLK